MRRIAHAASRALLWGLLAGPGCLSTADPARLAGGTDSQDVVINVIETNDPPILGGIPTPQSVKEAATLTFTVTAIDPDVPVQTLTLSAAGIPENASFDPATGVFTFTPGKTQAGSSCTVTFEVRDAAGAADSQDVVIGVARGIDAPAPAAVPTPQPVDRAPAETSRRASGDDVPTPRPVGEAASGTNAPPELAAVPTPQSVDEAATLSFTVAAVDLDLPPQTLTFSATGLPANASLDSTTGLFTFTPDETQGGSSYTVTFEVSDGPVDAEAWKPFGPFLRPQDGRGRIGARAGMLVTLGEEEAEYEGSCAVGVYYAGRTPEALGGLPFEAGLDLAWIDSDENAERASLYLFRFDVLFSGWLAYPRPDVYVLAGLEVVLGSTEGGDTEVVSGVDLGVGLTSLSGRWDARLTYSALIGSDNIDGLLLVTGGYRF